MKKPSCIVALLFLAWPALAQLTATVSPGYTFAPGERPTTDTLNLLGKPTIGIAGTVSGTVGLAAGTVHGIHFAGDTVDGLTIAINGSHELYILPGGVTSNQLALFTIQGTNIARQTIDWNVIAGEGIQSSNIVSGSISNLQIAAAAAIATSKLALSAGTGITISGDTISADSAIGVSSEHTWDNSGDASINVTHGLGAVPKYVRVVLVCKTGELGFSAGNEIPAEDVWHNDGSHVYDREFTYAATASLVTVYVWSGSTVFVKQGTLTPGSWNLKVYYAK
jgi:hypothetical protein